MLAARAVRHVRGIRLRSASSASPAASSISPVSLPGNPYPSRVAYGAASEPAERNPLRHTYADVGRYFDLCPDGESNSPAALAASFPEGIAGDLATEFEGASLRRGSRRRAPRRAATPPVPSPPPTLQ